MREYAFPIMGIAFILLGVSSIIALILTPRLNKDSWLYKYLTKTKHGKGGLDKYLEEHLSEKTKKTIEIVIGLAFCLLYIVLGLNILLKGLIDPYGPGFWMLF